MQDEGWVKSEGYRMKAGYGVPAPGQVYTCIYAHIPSEWLCSVPALVSSIWMVASPATHSISQAACSALNSCIPCSMLQSNLGTGAR